MVLVEDGLKFRSEKGVELVPSEFFFKGDICDKFEGEKTVSGIKVGNR